jgi:adenine-specific DNA methylase
MNEIFKKVVYSVNDYLFQLPENLPPVTISGLLASKTKPEMITSEFIDLVYLDPPFISNKKKRTLKFANYIKNYHVLETLANYKDFELLINNESRLINEKNYDPSKEMNLWLDQNQKKWLQSFEKIINNFQSSKIVVSYRSDSLISINQLKSILGTYKEVEILNRPHIYNNPEKVSKFDDILIICN